MKKYYLASILIHCWIFIFAFLGTGSGKAGNGDNPNGAPSKYKGVKTPTPVIAKANNKTEIAIIEVPKPFALKKKRKPHKKALKAVKKCPGYWYGGIGLEANFGDQISRVFPGYPAEIAGLRVGDIILEVEGGEMLGDPGTSFMMKVRRGEQILTFKLTRDKICY